jgi:hypothetical protein
MLWETSHLASKREMRKHNNHEEIETMLLRRVSPKQSSALIHIVNASLVNQENRRAMLKLKYRKVWHAWRQYWPAAADDDDDDKDDLDNQFDARAAAGGNSLSGKAETISLHGILHVRTMEQSGCC